MTKKPIVEVMEGGAKLAKALNDAGIPVTFGKRSEGNTDLSGVIDLASNNIGTGSIPLLEDIESRIHEELGIPFLTTNETGTNSLIWDIIEYDYDNDVVKYKDYELVNTDALTSGLNGKQNTLVSGTNIKTVNNESLLGSGDITITGVDIGTFTDLQTLITNASSGDTIILDKDYKYDSTTDSSLTNGIIINKNITIIGNGHIIDGNNTQRAFKISGGYTFNISDLTIQNCHYGGSGGAITLNNGTVNITNINFVKNLISTGYGGVIRADLGTLNINDSIFTKNKAPTAGVINAISGVNININNSYFIANSGVNKAGALYINGATLVMENSVFLANSASSYADIDCSSSTNVKNCIIPNIATSCHNVTNKSYLTDHQSLSSKQDLLVSGTNIATINNQSLLNGGNITIQEGAEVGSFTDLQDLIDDDVTGILILDKDYKYDSTTDSSLSTGIEIDKNITIIGNGHIIDGNNNARAFYINQQTAIVTLSDIRIQNCINSNYGGAIYIAYDSTVAINNSVFHNNIGNSCNGGAIYSDDSILILNNVLFTKNSAKNNTRAVINNEGGAIYTYDGELVLHSCIFNGNTASNYGDIYCQNTVTTSYDCIIPNIATSCYNVTNITTESLDTNKISKVDIVDNLTTNDNTKVLSAKQGKAIKDLIGTAIAYINL